jgi:inhibitor of KinA
MPPLPESMPPLPKPIIGRLDILAMGDRALVVEVADGVSEAATGRARRLAERLVHACLPGVREVVPAFCSVTVHYDPVVLCTQGPPFDVLRAQLQTLLSGAEDIGAPPGKALEIPVCYGGDYGEDLSALAAARDMAPSQFVELHCAPSYFVGMLGFAPGFPYLAGMDPRLIAPRRATPRPRVPAGSVAIGGEHTGIYPFESPGGWHLIGRTPLSLFAIDRDPPSLLQAGDRVRFVSIAPEAFEHAAEERARA